MKVLEFKPYTRPTPSVAQRRDIILYVLVAASLIYTTAIGLLVINTRGQVAARNLTQQATIHGLETRQLETETQLTVSTQSLARRLGYDEHDFQSQIDAKSAGFHHQLNAQRNGSSAGAATVPQDGLSELTR